uniref:Cardiomyopathy-associated protein 5 n=1 Tax=Callorhinchus milii TaxID=7868 RepID=A0A4W3JRA8_CALMI
MVPMFSSILILKMGCKLLHTLKLFCLFLDSLKNATKDQSVKPKMNYIMSSSSFSMVTVQSEDSGIIWETVSSSRSSTPWASESTVSDVYSVESSVMVDVDQNGSSFSTADRTTGVIPQSHSETIVNELSNEKDTKSKKDVFNIVAEGYEILNIIVPPKLYSVDQEACSNMQDNLMYLQKNPLIDKNKIEDEFECAGNVNREGNGQQLIPPNISDDDYFEKYTLLDEQVDLGKTGLKAQEVPVQVEGNPFPQVDNPVNLKSKSISFSDDTETFMFDEYDMSENPRSFVAMEDEFAQTHKPEGSLLFSTDEGVLSRSYYFPVSTKLAELALLEEPPALAFYYKDLYEEAKGRKEKDNGQSDEESNNSDLLFPSQSSDTDDGNGLYFEKYVLKDDVPGSLRELKTEESFSLMEALSQDNVIDVEADTVFSKDTSTFSAIHTDKAELPTQMRVSEETEVLDECAEKCETAKNETSHILSEIQPIQCEDLSEEAIQTMEDKVHDEISKEIVRFEDTASVDVQKSDSSVRDHVDSVQTAIPIDLFQELMKPGGEVGFCEDTVFVDPSVLKPGSFGGDHFDPAHITILSEFEEQEKPPSEAGACERTPYVEGKIQKPVSPVGNRFDSVHTTILSDSFEEPEIPPSEVGFEGVYNMPTSEQVEDIQNYTPSEEIAVCQIKADVMEKDLCVEDVAFVGTHEAEHLPTDVGEETEGELAEEFISSEAQVHQEINDNQSTERTVPMTVTDECQRVDQFISMDQRVSQKVIEGEIALVNQQLQLKSVQTPGNDTEQATYKGDIELLEAQMICIKDNEYLLKEPCPLESKEEEKMTEEAFPQITAYHKIASEPDDYKGIQAPSTNEEIKGESLTDEIAQALESEWDVLEVPIHESPTGITSCEQDSVYISRDVCQFQTEAFTYKEHGFHYRTISESVDDELDALQQQYLLENVQNQMEEGSETYPEGISQDLFAEDVKKGTDEIYLLEDTRIIDINVLAVPDYDLEFADKDLQELPVEERKNTDVQINEKEDTDVLTLEKSPKPMDTFCITCGFPIFAIDKLFGEHQDHEVTMIDAAMLKMKVSIFKKRNHENCTKEAKLLEEQHEEVMKLLLAQYTEMSQIMEEEKKVKLEHLYDQMVHYRCSIDSAKEAVEKTKESIQNDDITFLQVCLYKGLFANTHNECTAQKQAIRPNQSMLVSIFHKIPSTQPASRPALPVPPSSPTVLPQEPNSATSTTVTVYWKVGEDDVIDYFQVYSVDESEGSVSDEYRMAVKESYCTLDNLDPSRRYLVWVMAVNFSGCSLPSEKVTVRTVPSAPVLNPEECSVCWDSATIRWSSADLDDVDIFTLEFHRQSDLRRSTFRSVSGIRGCEQTVKLQPQEDFLFYITAVNDIGSSDKSRPALISTKRTRFHLNKETVPPNLQLSEDGTLLSTESLHFFNRYPPVLGEPLPTSGQHYWETTVDRCQAYRIGVAYPITTRNCTLGQSLASWCMRYYVTPAGHKYEFLHNSAAHEVFITDFVTRVGILLNGDGSQLSFFNAQSGQLLHSFQHRFTDLICPAFTVEKPVFLAVCTGAELPEFAKCS